MDIELSTFKMFLSKTGRALLMFGGIVFFSRHLGQTQLGIFFLFFAMQGLLSIPADFGLRNALEKRLSEGEDAVETLSSALVLKLILLTLVSLVILSFQTQVNEYLGEEFAVLLVVAVILRELSLFYIHAVRGRLQVGRTASIEFGRRLTWVGLGAFLITQGFGTKGVIYGLLAGSSVAFVWAFLACDVGIGRPTVTQMQSLFNFSKYDAINSVGGSLYQWMDTALIGFFLAQSFVGAYEVAWQVTLLVLMFSKSISLTLFPQISQWNATSSAKQIESTISTALGFAVFFSIPAVVGSVIYGTDVLRLLFGPEYVIASLVLIVLMVEKVFQSFNDIVGVSVRAINKPNLAAKSTIAAVGVNLLLSPILIINVGFVGAAIATTLAWMVNVVLHTHYLSRHIDFSIPYRLIGWFALSSIAMGVVVYGVKTVFPVDTILMLILHVAIGGFLYLAFSVAIPKVRRRILIPTVRVLASRYVSDDWRSWRGTSDK
ncbi:polysaccharide biosynthesis C-terminal domain-containing protein [Haloferax sp. YSSS75]|uniref:oligosaccharide flippase family protein n=1 Tax=Haloferax sp. YSSS75 TaxID=3388564 RepID=UPI00398D5FCE